MSVSKQTYLAAREERGGIWLSKPGSNARALLAQFEAHDLRPELLESESSVGRAMLEEIQELARTKSGDLVIVLLGGRGAQALHRLLGEIARAGDKDEIIARLRVFTQDALAPLGMKNSLSFVRDFERLLGTEFFKRIRSFSAMRTDAADLKAELIRYVQELEALGGVDILFLGHGPEPDNASHVAYIRPNSGASAVDLAGIIPISSNILDHHITKFKAGGAAVTVEDESECRLATHILTLGPATILDAKRIVQSIVDADTAPAKKASLRRVMDERISQDPDARAKQLDENPGLWVRLNPNVRSLVLQNALS